MGGGISRKFFGLKFTEGIGDIETMSGSEKQEVVWYGKVSSYKLQLREQML